MTIMTKMTIKHSAEVKMKWTVAEAKAKLSEVIQRAETEGPQRDYETR